MLPLLLVLALLLDSLRDGRNQLVAVCGSLHVIPLLGESSRVWDDL